MKDEAANQPGKGGRASSFIFHLSSFVVVGYFVQVTTTILKIDGMNCGKCERSIVHTLEQLPKVSRAEAFPSDKQVRIEHEPDVSVEEILIRAIEREGFGVRRQTAAG